MEDLVIGEGELCTHKVARVIRQNTSFGTLVRNWKSLGRSLGVKDANLLNLERKINLGLVQLDEVAYELLAIWISKEGSDATLKALHDALCENDMCDIAESLEKQFAATLLIKTNFAIPTTPSYYIPRTVFRITKLNPAVLKYKEQVFLLKNISKYDLAKHVPPESIAFSGTQLSRLTHHKIIIECDGDYDMIAEMSDQPVHLIEHKNGSLYWIKSSKNTSIIRAHLDYSSTLDSEQTENDWVSEMYKTPLPMIVSISDSPGMGKTTLLANIAKRAKNNSHSNMSVMYIVLHEFMQWNTSMMLSSTDALLALMKYSCGRLLTKTNATLHSQEIQLFLDGYDEITETNLEATNKFLQHLRGVPNLRLYAATRPHLAFPLENILRTISFEILPFDRRDQVNFLTKFWIDEHKIQDKHQLKEFAEKCLTMLQENMTDEESEIAGIPLQCWMLAEVYATEAKRHVALGNKTEFVAKVTSVFEMYKQLVKLKFERLLASPGCCESLKYSDVRDVYLEAHVYHAVTVLFPDWTEKLERNLTKHESVNEHELFSIGLLEKRSSSRQPRFVHRTFAEYLLAEFLVKNIGRSSECIDLAFGMILKRKNEKKENGKHLYNPHPEMKYPVLSYFMENHLKTYLVKIDTLMISLYIQSKTIDYDEMCAGLATCCYQNFENLFDLTSNVLRNIRCSYPQNLFENFKSLPGVAVKYYNSFSLLRNVLLCIKTMFNINATYFFVDPANENDINILCDKSLIHMAVNTGNFEIVKSLKDDWNVDMQNVKCLLHACVWNTQHLNDRVIDDRLILLDFLCELNRNALEERYQGATPLLERNIHFKIVERLVQLGADINAVNLKTNQHLLHNICRGKDSYKERIFWAKSNGFSLFNLKNSNGGSIIHHLLWSNGELDEDVLKFLHKEGINFNATDNLGDSVFFAALTTGRPDTISKVFNYVDPKCVTATNKQNENALHCFIKAAKQNGQNVQNTLEVIDFLFAKGLTDVDGVSAHSMTPLMQILSKSNLPLDKNISSAWYTQVLEHFKQKGANFNAEDYIGDSILFHALKENHCEEIVLKILECGANVNHVNNEGETAIHVVFGSLFIHSRGTGRRSSTNQWKLAIMKLLVENNFIKINTEDIYGETPLMRALSYQLDSEMLNFFHQNKAKFTKVSKRRSLCSVGEDGYQDSILFRGLRKFLSVDLIRQIIDYGANVNYRNHKYENAVHIIFQEAKLEKPSQGKILPILNCLMEKGFSHINGFTDDEDNGLAHNINSLADDDGPECKFITSLHYAVRLVPIDVGILLWFYENNADFNATSKDKYSDSVLFEAVKHGQNDTIVKKIIEYGGDLSYTNKLGESCLHVATFSNNLPVVAFLTDEMIDINAGDHLGNTSLHQVFHSRYAEYYRPLMNVFWGEALHNPMIKLLIERGANFNARNKDGEVPLVYWIRKSRLTEILQIYKLITISEQVASEALSLFVKKPYLLDTYLFRERADTKLDLAKVLHLLLDKGGKLANKQEINILKTILFKENNKRFIEIRQSPLLYIAFLHIFLVGSLNPV